jgi:hypothetical protein
MDISQILLREQHPTIQIHNNLTICICISLAIILIDLPLSCIIADSEIQIQVQVVTSHHQLPLHLLYHS